MVIELFRVSELSTSTKTDQTKEGRECQVVCTNAKTCRRSIVAPHGSMNV